MTFYETDKHKAARILFDAITDLEAAITVSGGLGNDGLPIGVELGKVIGARHYLAATLGISVVSETVEIAETAEPKRALEVVS